MPATRPQELDRLALEDARETCWRRLVIASWTMSTIMLVAHVVGRIVLHGRPEDAPGRDWMPILVLVPILCGLTMRFAPPARIRPMAWALPFYLTEAALGGIMLGRFGGLDGPYFYAAYVIPPFLIALPVSLRMRIAATAATEFAFVSAFLFQQPTLLQHPMIHIPAVYVFTVSAFNILMGHEMTRLHLDRFRLVTKLEQGQDTLHRRNRTLEAHVRERIRAAEDLAEEIAFVRDRERRHVAATLHDNLAQVILAARLQADTLARTHVGSADAEDINDAVEGVLAALHEASRSAIDALRAADTRRSPDVGSLLRSTIERHPGRGRVDLVLDEAAARRTVDARAAAAIEAFAREGLTNAIRHGDAQTIHLEAHLKDGALRLVLTDDGPGLHGPDLLGADGLGLAALDARAAEAGGAFLALPGATGRIELALPIGEDDA